MQSGGATMVVDGGSARAEVYGEPHTIRLERFLRDLGVTRVDLLCITHIHEDHIGGLPAVVEQFPVGEIWCNICPQGDIEAMLVRLGAQAQADPSGALFYRALEAYGRIRALAERRGIPLRAMPGGAPTMFGGLTVTPLGMSPSQLAHIQARFNEMIAAEDERLLFDLFHENDFICNATSLALHVREGAFAALLTGDKVGGWEALRRQADLRAQVLKITHHGQKDGMPQAMLEGADPQAIVVCCDKKRTFQGADPAVLRRAAHYLEQNGRAARVFVTGALRQGGRAGNVLTLSQDDSPSCTKASVEFYE